MREWTAEQREATRFTGGSLLVSAAAGAGKTAVVAERCVHLVSRASPRVHIDQLLVVTFTEAAATEMRERISMAIRRAAQANPDDRHLARQMAFVDRASISTIHSFCSKLLRARFTEAGLDPNFQILDADEAGLLKWEIVEKLFEDSYAAGGPASAALTDLVDQYGDGQDSRIMQITLDLHDMLTSVVNPGDWLERARQWLAAPGDRLPAAMADMHRRQILDRVVAVGQAVRQAADVVAGRLPAMEFYHDRLVQVRDVLADWHTRLRVCLIRPEGGSVRECATAVPAVAAAHHGSQSRGTPLVGQTLSGAAPADLDVLKSEITQYRFPDLRGGVRAAKDEALAAVKDRVVKLYNEVRRQFTDQLVPLCRFTEAQYVEGLRRTAPHAGQLIDLVGDFGRRYTVAKTDRRAVDFDDLQRRTLALLTDDPSSLTPSATALQLQDEFAYVLVDEYQDINPIQDAILRLVSREGRPDATPNLFCVGDVKQSIYRFRLADPSIFTARARLLAGGGPGEVINLRANFRSRPAVIDAVNLVFERLMTGVLDDVTYTAESRLVAKAAFPRDEEGRSFGIPGAEVHLLDWLRGAEAPGESSDEAKEGPTEIADWEILQREAYLIATRINELIAGGIKVAERTPDGRSVLRPIRYGDIVILLRATQYNANMVAGILQRFGIPVYAEMTSGYFESIEVLDVLSLLQIMDNSRQDIPLAAVLRGPIGRLSASQILAIREYRPVSAFCDAVFAYAKDGPDRKTRTSLSGLLTQLDRWRTAARRGPLADVLWRIYQETGLLAYVGGLSMGPQRRANLIKLHEEARRFGTFSRQGLPRFLRFLAALQGAGGDMGAAPTVGEADNVVRVMSVHRSKGLEFPVVFVAHLGKRFNFSDASGPIVFDRDSLLGLQAVDAAHYTRYPTLAYQLVSDRIERQTRAEELRILYVAMTRAKERLILVGTTDVEALENRRAEGGVPESRIYGANTALDWLIPALWSAAGHGVAFRSDPGPQLQDDAAITVHPHQADEIIAWPEVGRILEKEAEQLRRFARLSRVGEPDGSHPALIDDLAARLLTPYAFDRLTRVPTTVSVSEVKRRLQTETQPEAMARRQTPVGQWPRPRFAVEIEGPAEPSPTERGTITHLVLQHLDLGRLRENPDVRAQVGEMIERGLLDETEAAAVDTDSLNWYLATPVGRRVVEHADRAHREVSFLLSLPAARVDPAAPASDDPADRVLVRGIIDLLLDLDDGLVILDYKTDRPAPGRLRDLVEIYRPQVSLYAEAIGEIWARPVIGRYLAFLHPREMVSL